MRYLSQAILVNFRCFSDIEIAILDDMSVFAGMNNSGKSSLLHSLRRVVSSNINRHPPKANPGGAAFWGPSTYLRLLPTDHRDDTDETNLVLVVDKSIINRLENSSFHRWNKSSDWKDHVEKLFANKDWPIIIRAQFKKNSSPEISILEKTNGLSVDFKELLANSATNSGKKADSEQFAKNAIEILDSLPIVIIPEFRTLSTPTSILPPSRPDTFREEIVNADLLLPQLLSWACEEPEKLVIFNPMLKRF